jgi:nitrogenase molybdenum-iron protein alpha chain
MRIFVSAGSTRAVTLSALADELGFQLVGLNTYHYDEVIAASLEKLVARQGDFLLSVANMQPFEQANLLNRLQPDLYLGVSSWAAKQGIPTVVGVSPLGSTFGFGYNGVLKVGTKLVEALENPGFNLKLARHKKLPYRASWYETDPFAHIVPFGGEEL